MLSHGHGRRVRLGLCALALAGAAGTARATWSIVIVDTRTREVAVGSATCLTNFDLQANTPVVIVGVGGATAQSSVDSDGTNRTFIRDKFYAGVAPDQILAGLATFDSAHQSRQYGMVDTLGRATTFSGNQDGHWAGGRTGKVGTLVYAVQGNVLTGQPVVDSAANAIENAPGDLAEKLMVAMEAARSFGGDGRCSCSQSAPDSCGSPPPNFTKAADIAYMIVARIGDRDGSNGCYRILGTGGASLMADVTGDGLREFITASGVGLGVMRNLSRALTPPILAPLSVTPATGMPRGLAAGNFNGDGFTDVFLTDITNDRVMAFAGTNTPTLTAPVPFATGDGPTVIATGDFNHDGLTDVVNLNSNTATLSVLLNTGGALGPPTSLPVPAGTTMLQAGDLDHDGDTDVVVASPTAKQIAIFTCNGAGALAAGPVFTFTLQPVLMTLGDSNGDSLLDIFYTLSSERMVHVLKQDGQGGFVTLNVSTGSFTPAGLAAVDADGDGTTDIVFSYTAGAVGRLAVMRGLGNDTFAAPVSYPVGFNGTALSMADLNGDGLPDAVIPQISNGVVTVMQNSGGKFNPISGLAGGDYFLDFNIANQSSSAVDPVFQLRDRYNTWAAAQAGIPDAVQTVAAFDPPVVRANGVAQAVLVIQGRDRSLAPVALDPAGVSIQSLAGSPIGTIGAPTSGGDGTIHITVTAGTACASESFRVKVTGGGKTVTLMPDVTLVYTSPADYNLDTFMTGDDIDAFAPAYYAGDPSADVNGDGVVNTDDFDYYIVRFNAGC